MIIALRMPCVNSVVNKQGSWRFDFITPVKILLNSLILRKSWSFVLLQATQCCIIHIMLVVDFIPIIHLWNDGILVSPPNVHQKSSSHLDLKNTFMHCLRSSASNLRSLILTGNGALMIMLAKISEYLSSKAFLFCAVGSCEVRLSGDLGDFGDFGEVDDESSGTISLTNRASMKVINVKETLFGDDAESTSRMR